MDISKVFKNFFLIFLFSSIFCPAAGLISFLFGFILGELGDCSAETFFKYTSIGFSALWAISLVSLLLLLAAEKFTDRG